jgi:hypothetical protein
VYELDSVDDEERADLSVTAIRGLTLTMASQALAAVQKLHDEFHRICRLLPMGDDEDPPSPKRELVHDASASA